MKNSIFILIILFSSCNPFISKDLRKKNRCNRKLEKVVTKCPDLLKQDTTIVNFDTTIVTNEVQVDTIVKFDFDTLEIVKDKFHLKLIRTTDTLLINGGCEADTIFIEKFIEVPFEKVSKIELTLLEQLQNLLSRFWYWLIVIFAMLLLYKFFKK